jgi:hypothetical protein
MSFIGDIVDGIGDVADWGVRTVGRVAQVIPGVTAGIEATKALLHGGQVAIQDYGQAVQYYSTAGQTGQPGVTQSSPGFVGRITSPGPLGLPNYVWLAAVVGGVVYIIRR